MEAVSGVGKRPVACAQLLGPQSFGRCDACCATGRKPAGERRDTCKQHRYRDHREWIRRSYAEQQVRQQPR
jgi:hypothetical protein